MALRLDNYTHTLPSPPDEAVSGIVSGLMSSPEAPAGPTAQQIDPVLRIVLRYSVDAKEYGKLHRLLVQRLPRSIRKSAPSPASYETVLKNSDDFNPSAIRVSVRLFLGSRIGLKLWERFKIALTRRRKGTELTPPAAGFLSADTRLSFSLALLLLFHRLMHRFMTRLRANLLDKNSQPFRRRNPKISKALTSRLAPSIGASLAGFALAVSPADQLRITIAIYASTRGAEFIWNALEGEGWFKNRPWWFGSWMLMPGVFGELLYAFLFEKDCFPKPYGDFIMRFSDTFVHQRPENYPSHLPWPSNDGIVNGLAEIARLHYPAFESPILHPKATLPASLSQLAPIVNPAHPGISNLSCATIHPSQPSCMRTYLTFFGEALPRFAKFFTLVLALFSIPRYKAFLQRPGEELNKLAERILRLSLFVTGAIGTSWGSICLFQSLFPRSLLPKGRFFLGGFMGGFWALLVRRGGRGQFLYSLRSALDSGYKVGVKKGWWKSRQGGDVLVFVASLAAINVVFERNPEAVSSGLLRRGLAGLRGEGWGDRAKELADKTTDDKRD